MREERSKLVETPVETLGCFINWVEKLELGDYIFRGVLDECYEIQASTYTRLKDGGNKNIERLLEVNKGLIEDARLLGHDEREGQEDFSDLEMLAELQHYQAATCLIDFTYSAQVALWFACQPNSKETNGKLVAVRNNPHEVKEITSELVGNQIDYFFQPREDRTYPIYRWQPQQQNNRIIAQQSVFLFGRGEIEVEAECIIPSEDKKDILASLEKAAGITEATLFPDFDGFARLHAHNRHLSVNSVQTYLQRASRAHGRNKLSDAIRYYTEAIRLQEKQLGDCKEKKSLLSYLYLRRGWAHSEQDSSLEAAIADYDKAIELNEENVRAYRSKGYAKYKQEEYEAAIDYYDEAIKLDKKHILTYARRGVVKFKCGRLGEADKDFREAINLAETAKNNDLETQIKEILGVSPWAEPTDTETPERDGTAGS